MLQDNFNLLQSETLTDECLIAKKIYGRCKQQDCLKPIDYSRPPMPKCPNDVLPSDAPESIAINSSLFGDPTNPITSRLSNPSTGGPLIYTGTGIPSGNPIVFNETVANIKVSNFKTLISLINVSSPGQFGLPGFYDVTVKYTFYYTLTFYTATDTAIPFIINGDTTTTSVPAYTSYTKEISLEGGVVDPNISIAIGDSGASPYNIPQPANNVPYAYVQAIANPLTVRNGKYPDPTSTTTPTTWAYHADVIIGLFTIIELYRISNMTVASAGPLEVPQCQPSIVNDPCVGFNQLLFPYDDFDPPYRKC